ncbi:MAG: signal peptidase I [Clostridia bacterium]|nr:signal peptidase I [Clostridia bacterium]
MSEFEDNNIAETVKTEVQTPSQPPTGKFKKEAAEWIQAIVVAVVLALIIRTFIFTVVKVDGPSMEETLHHEERLIVWRLLYQPTQGDIIIFHPAKAPEKCYVKRIIATEGQSVYVDYENNQVLVDGYPIDEPYIPEAMRPIYTSKEMIVPEDSVFVMGDNRNHSSDSRDSTVGFVKKSSILGKAVIRFWPFNKLTVF